MELPSQKLMQGNLKRELCFPPKYSSTVTEFSDGFEYGIITPSS